MRQARIACANKDLDWLDIGAVTHCRAAAEYCEILNLGEGSYIIETRGTDAAGTFKHKVSIKKSTTVVPLLENGDA